MNSSSLEVFPELNLNPASISERSYLYCLEPIGIGTGSIECLTSYISRIAEAHCVDVGRFAALLLIPNVQKDYVVPISYKIGPAYKNTISGGRRFKGLNGLDSNAIDYAKTMNELASRNDLQLLTMYAWSNILPTRKMARHTQAWCPYCYEEWNLKGERLYVPLIWNFQVVEICKVHNNILYQSCPKCNCTMDIFSNRIKPGYCSNCNNWLGLPDQYDKQLKINDLNWSNWVYDSVLELIAHSEFFFNNSFNVNEIISENLKKIIERLTKGNTAEFARKCGVPKNTLFYWYKGKTIPSIDSLLKICYIADVSLTTFLTTKEFEINKNCLSESFKNFEVYQKRNYKYFDAKQVEQQLLEIVNSNSPPFPSLNATERQIGINRKTLSKYFPQLCRLISKRYLDYKSKLKENKIQELCQEVREATIKLYNEGIYPSRRKVEAMCSQQGMNFHQEVKETWCNTKEELGLL